MIEGSSNIDSLGLDDLEIDNIANIFSRLTNFNPLGYDLFEFVDSLGGSVEYTDSGNLEFCMGGLKVFGKKDFIIFLDSKISKENINFTIAHELGHYVIHSLMGTIKVVSEVSESGMDYEKEANKFAMDFLLPKKLFIKEFYLAKGSIKSLANKFNVSNKLIKIRCNYLNLW